MEDSLLDKCFSMLATEFIIYNIKPITMNGIPNSIHPSETILENIAASNNKHLLFKVFCSQVCSPQRLFYFTVMNKFESAEDNSIFYHLLYQPTDQKQFFYKFAFESYSKDQNKRHIYIFEDVRTINDKDYGLYKDFEKLLAVGELRFAIGSSADKNDSKFNYEKTQILERCYKRAKSVYKSHKVDLWDEGNNND